MHCTPTLRSVVLLRAGLLLLLALPLLGQAQAASRHTPPPITVQDDPRPGGG